MDKKLRNMQDIINNTRRLLSKEKYDLDKKYEALCNAVSSFVRFFISARGWSLFGLFSNIPKNPSLIMIYMDGEGINPNSYWQVVRNLLRRKVRD